MIRLKVREVAEAKGFKTAGRLARESKVSYATVHQLWNEPDASPGGISLGVLVRLAYALGVPVSELYEVESGNWLPELLKVA